MFKPVEDREVRVVSEVVVMDELKIVRIADVAPYAGPHAIPGIRFRAVREVAGVSSWGMNVLELDPGCDAHPEHDHASDGHEEVYLVLRGSAVLRADGKEHRLATGDLARVPGSVRRKLLAEKQGATVLALGGNPGRPYTPSMGG